jgi:hypothetical protein
MRLALSVCLLAQTSLQSLQTSATPLPRLLFASPVGGVLELPRMDVHSRPKAEVGLRVMACIVREPHTTTTASTRPHTCNLQEVLGLKLLVDMRTQNAAQEAG